MDRTFPSQRVEKSLKAADQLAELYFSGNRSKLYSYKFSVDEGHRKNFFPFQIVRKSFRAIVQSVRYVSTDCLIDRLTGSLNNLIGWAQGGCGTLRIFC